MRLAAIFLIITLALGLYSYYNISNRNAEIARLVLENSKLNIEVDSLVDGINRSNETIKMLKVEAEKNYERFNKVEDEFDVYRQQEKIYNDKLFQSDLNKLALENPDLLENLINSGTRNALRCLEILSGSPKTPFELGAKTGEEFNTECPWLK